MRSNNHASWKDVQKLGRRFSAGYYGFRRAPSRQGRGEGEQKMEATVVTENGLIHLI